LAFPRNKPAAVGTEALYLGREIIGEFSLVVQPSQNIIGKSQKVFVEVRIVSRPTELVVNECRFAPESAMLV
jgi:hypothetical protein